MDEEEEGSYGVRGKEKRNFIGYSSLCNNLSCVDKCFAFLSSWFFLFSLIIFNSSRCLTFELSMFGWLKKKKVEGKKLRGMKVNKKLYDFWIKWLE